LPGVFLFLTFFTEDMHNPKLIDEIVRLIEVLGTSSGTEMAPCTHSFFKTF
jgi:hypothetical protein